MNAQATVPSRSSLVALQNRLAAAFGISPADRDLVVKTMLERSWRASAGYWLQLLIAMGIATLGLVLGSTAVVIGAMLISPLMTPIVEFGMGLAVGSPFLVMRSFALTATSVVVVVASAALLTLTLPFHEVTSEIAARASPTALDLMVAAFCAVSAAYTTMRPRSDTTSTAAGTAIGIALVPPLCVVGYGIGTRAPTIAGGAALLFTANFCAIVLLAVLSFLLVGYGHGSVHVGELEGAELEREDRGVIRRIARALQVVFRSKYGPALRVLMPLALVGLVYVPLRSALAEVSWQVRVRDLVQRQLDALPGDAVRSTVAVERHAVTVRLVTLGTAEDAARLERELRERIAIESGVVPNVSVVAVPNASALQEIAATLKAPPAPLPSRQLDLAFARERLGAALVKVWPREAGALLEWHLEFPAGERTRMTITHAGPELGGAGATLLGQAMSREIDGELAARDVAVSLEPVEAEPEAGLAWLPAALRALDQLGASPALRACAEIPAGVKGWHLKDAEAVTAALRTTLAFRGGRLHLGEGPRWRVFVSTGECVVPPAGGRDAGAPVDAAVPTATTAR